MPFIYVNKNAVLNGFNTCIEESSARTEKQHAVPVQANMKAYTAPAEPPLWDVNLVVADGRGSNYILV